MAAPDRHRRVVAEQVDGLPGLAHGLLADRAGVAPLEGHVLPQQQPGLVGGVVELGPGDVGVDAEQVEPGVDGQGRHRRGPPRARRRPAPCAVGPWLAPLRKMRSPLTEAIQARRSKRRRPVRRTRRSLSRPGPRVASSSPSSPVAGGSPSWVRTSMTTSWRGWSPRAWGHQRSGSAHGDRPADLVLPGGEGVDLLGVDAGRPRCAPSPARGRPRRGRRGPSPPPARRSPREHSTRRWRMRTGPVRSMCTGRQIPPGLPSGSAQSQCWKTPVRLRLAVRSPGRLQVRSTPRECSSRAARASVTSKPWGKK